MVYTYLSAPTHYAADAITEAIEKFSELIGEQWVPLRIYRASSEIQAFKSPGLGDEDFDDEASSVDDV